MKYFKILINFFYGLDLTEWRNQIFKDGEFFYGIVKGEIEEINIGNLSSQIIC